MGAAPNGKQDGGDLDLFNVKSVRLAEATRVSTLRSTRNHISHVAVAASCMWHPTKLTYRHGQSLFAGGQHSTVGGTFRAYWFVLIQIKLYLPGLGGGNPEDDEEENSKPGTTGRGTAGASKSNYLRCNSSANCATYMYQYKLHTPYNSCICKLLPSCYFRRAPYAYNLRVHTFQYSFHIFELNISLLSWQVIHQRRQSSAWRRCAVL